MTPLWALIVGGIVVAISLTVLVTLYHETSETLDDPPPIELLDITPVPVPKAVQGDEFHEIITRHRNAHQAART